MIDVHTHVVPLDLSFGVGNGERLVGPGWSSRVSVAAVFMGAELFRQGWSVRPGILGCAGSSTWTRDGVRSPGAVAHARAVLL